MRIYEDPEKDSKNESSLKIGTENLDSVLDKNDELPKVGTATKVVLIGLGVSLFALSLGLDAMHRK